jgi:hypothetical protein
LSSYFDEHFFLYVYADVIVDITPQLITLNQRSKSNQVSLEQTFKFINIYIKNSFVFVPKSRSPNPKGHFRHRISKCEIQVVFIRKKNKNNQSKAEIDEKRFKISLEKNQSKVSR